jgi:hypothetical protein
MGSFKDLRKLNQVGKEVNAKWDVGAQLANAQQAMSQANASMALAAQRSSNAAVDGVMTTATVTSVQSTGGFVNHSPMLRLDLLVNFQGIPTPVSVTEVVMMHHLAKAVNGAVLQVRVGATPQDLFVYWDHS